MVKDVENHVQKFNRDHCGLSFTERSRKYVELLASREDDHKKFIELNNSISQCCNDLNFGLNVYDEQSRRDDVEAIQSSMDGIVSQMTEMLDSKQLPTDMQSAVDMMRVDIAKSLAAFEHANVAISSMSDTIALLRSDSKVSVSTFDNFKSFIM